MLNVHLGTVKANIDKLENLYLSGNLEIDFCLKLATLEACGWIELKMNKIISDYLKGNIRNIVLCEELSEIIKNKNYGFKYKRHFREKLVCVFGEEKLIVIEKRMQKKNNFEFSHFKHVLSELSKERDRYAHTYTRKNQGIHIGFSDIKIKLMEINKGLIIFQEYIKRRIIN